MIKIQTKRLVGFSDIVVENGCIKSDFVPQNATMNLLSLKPTTGMEQGFVFYSIDDPRNMICHIGLTFQRNKFEISYGTEPPYRRKGYMTEALVAFAGWLFENTSNVEIWALPNGAESEHILQKCGFLFIDHYEKNSSMKWYLKRKAEI